MPVWSSALLMLPELQAQGLRCGLMFGPERSGLENDDVTLAQAVLRVQAGDGLTALRAARGSGLDLVFLDPPYADGLLPRALEAAAAAVRRRLRVALFSTGDEVIAPGQPLPLGCIYDSNRFALTAALQRLNMEVIDLGLVRDDRDALQRTLDEALQRADVVLTSGGVSAGDADYTRDVLARLGEVAFWKVAMRPGRPFAFGPLRGKDGKQAMLSLGDVLFWKIAMRPGRPFAFGPLRGAGGRTAWLFALPGNPVAALVTFYAFAREALLQLAGATPEPIPVLQARSVAPIRKRPGRTEFQRAVVSRAADGLWEVRIGTDILYTDAEGNYLIQGNLVLSAILLMIGNLISDLLLALVDPRIRYG